MLQDLENNKPTEIDALTGYVSAQGKKHAIRTPRCDLLNALIRFKQQN
jgi:2-dehydropantoate 2-reductase